MNNLVIKTHDFEAAKKGLKEFSQKKSKELELDTVKTDGGFFGLGNHKVTGYELNDRLSTIQQHLIDLNNTNNRTIKEFGQVYSALEALDKDYIHAILISIKATEETSKRIEATQKQIKKIVDDQKKTLEVLKRFKEKLDSYDHLGDIDKIWNDCQKWHKDITRLSNSINNVVITSDTNAKEIESLKSALNTTDEKADNLEELLKQQIIQLESIIAFTCVLEEIVHLRDIDEMWESLSNAHNSLLNIYTDVNAIRNATIKQQSDIETLLQFMDMLSGYEHLKDIDEIWNKTGFHSNQLSELEKQMEETKNLIGNNRKLMDVTIADVVEKNDIAVQTLTEKIKYAYLLAGGSLGIALIALIVILFKVI